MEKKALACEARAKSTDKAKIQAVDSCCRYFAQALPSDGGRDE
jgi:hypothetical protein